MPAIGMFGLKFIAVTLNEAASLVVQAAILRKRSLVVTPNVDHIVMLQTDRPMFEIYRNADFVFADGMPLVWMSKFLPQLTLPMRVTGADLLPKVCGLAQERKLKVLFMGGQQGVAAKAAQKLRGIYPNLDIVGTYCPPFGFEHDPEETARMIGYCNLLKPDLLFLGVGAPKQEKWAAAHLHQLDVGPVLCVGAAFDFAAGTATRAPLVLQKLGLEWCWRLSQEPKRLWRRYVIQDSKFFFWPHGKLPGLV